MNPNLSLPHLSDLPGEPVDLAIYRYHHLYVVQGSTVTILDPQANTVRRQLPFIPTTWSSYGGAFCLYDTHTGIAQIVGKDLAVVDTPKLSLDRFAAPYGVPMKNFVPIVGGHEGLHPPETNGVMWDADKHGGVWLPVQKQRLNTDVRAAAIEPDQWLLFTGNQDSFSYYNGTAGKLMYGMPPEKLVPYLYPAQGLLAAGHPEGYLFSPDMGRSWRMRKLDGWGVMTESAIVQVDPRFGVRSIRGWW